MKQIQMLHVYAMKEVDLQVSKVICMTSIQEITSLILEHFHVNQMPHCGSAMRTILKQYNINMTYKLTTMSINFLC